jgi:hypothetical protein
LGFGFRVRVLGHIWFRTHFTLTDVYYYYNCSYFKSHIWLSKSINRMTIPILKVTYGLGHIWFRTAFTLTDVYYYYNYCLLLILVLLLLSNTTTNTNTNTNVYYYYYYCLLLLLLLLCTTTTTVAFRSGVPQPDTLSTTTVHYN